MTEIETATLLILLPVPIPLFWREQLDWMQWLGFSAMMSSLPFAKRQTQDPAKPDPVFLESELEQRQKGEKGRELLCGGVGWWLRGAQRRQTSSIPAPQFPALPCFPSLWTSYTIVVPFFCAFRPARVRLGFLVTWPAGALVVWPCLSGSAIWPPLLSPLSPCVPAALTLRSSLDKTSLLLLPGLCPWLFSLSVISSKRQLLTTPKLSITLACLISAICCYLKLSRASSLPLSPPSSFLFHLHFPVRISALRR